MEVTRKSDCNGLDGLTNTFGKVVYVKTGLNYFNLIRDSL